MPEEPEQNAQISSKAEQQAKPPTSTNAGVVVAWIGIVLCGISLGLFVASICVWLIAALVNPDDAIPYFLRAVGYFFRVACRMLVCSICALLSIWLKPESGHQAHALLRL